MQCIGYNILSEPKFLMRSLSLAGAVLLILAETRTSTHTVFDLPTLGGDKPKVQFIVLRLNKVLWTRVFMVYLGPISSGLQAKQMHMCSLNSETKYNFRVIFNCPVELC